MSREFTMCFLVVTSGIVLRTAIFGSIYARRFAVLYFGLLAAVFLLEPVCRVLGV